MNKLKFVEPVYKKMGVYELTINEDNLRKISKKGFKRLKDKIIQNIYQPIKIWKKDNTILSGNQRLGVLRHLIEDEGYDIPHINVAVYDVDEKTARFIEWSDNTHEGDWDFEKMMEQFEEIEAYGFKELFDPMLMKKLEAKIGRENFDIGDIPDEKFDEIIEIKTRDLIISNVPKSQIESYYEVIDRVKKIINNMNEWKCLKAVVDCINNMDNNELKDFINSGRM